MIFQHTHELVMSGAKTESSRIAKDGETFAVVDGKPTVFTASGRIKYQVGQVRAVQPARTAKGIGLVRITGIEDKSPVDRCTLESAGREVGMEPCLYAYYKFMEIWNSIHGMGLKKTFSRGPLVWRIRFEVIHE